MDLSHLDKKYFLDYRRYNCPFCNRGSVTYKVINKSSFNWSDEKAVHIYLVQCQEADCRKISMHLSYFNFYSSAVDYFYERPENLNEEIEYDSKKLDDYFFLHQPTSFFTIDSRINKKFRELISESENCLKMNFLVGASACLRKAIYELVDMEKVKILRDNGLPNYKESIKKLKDKFSKVPGEYFDALAGIQELVSDKIHEGSWEAWSAKKLNTLIELTKNVLHEMYVTPEEQKIRAGVVNKLLGKFNADKSSNGKKGQ